MLYQAVDEALEDVDADLDAAEAHGIAVGMLVTNAQVDAGDWLHEVLGDAVGASRSSESLLLDMFEKTQECLAGALDEFNFDLLLPDDAEPLFEQVEALVSWCRGFLFGLGYAQSADAFSKDLAEIIRDITEFTKIDSATVAEDEADALMEVREYIRAAVFTIRDYFHVPPIEQIH